MSWKVRYINGTNRHVFIDDEWGGTLAKMKCLTEGHRGAQRDTEQMLRDANLMAAAPKMLAVLKRILEGGAPKHSEKQIIAAIAKAEGKS